MKKSEIVYIIIACIITFLFVYSPHFNYQYPFHIDEWHHITEGLKLKNHEYSFKFNTAQVNGFELGFQAFLMVLSYFIDLVTYYQYFSAIWAVITALILFYVVYKKTNNNFYIGLFSMIFFASIKSNVNILGLWYFTPLTFSIPFIFLYIYFFTEGIDKRNKKYTLISLGIMILLVFSHAVSVLFSIPFLIIYALTNLNYLEKEWKFFSLFLLVPLAGFLFFMFGLHLTPIGGLLKIIDSLQFKYGWGVFEFNNSFYEVYSFIGYFLAVVGGLCIFIFHRKDKKYYAYVLWPISVLIFIFIFKITKISYLAPFQRDLYYFAIALPFLSGIGLYCIFNLFMTFIEKTKYKRKEIIKIIAIIALLLFAFSLTFKDYSTVPDYEQNYRLIDSYDYTSLKYLSQFPGDTVIAVPGISMAAYSVAHEKTVFGIFFYNTENDYYSNQFFNIFPGCYQKENIIRMFNVSYVISKGIIPCNWTLVDSDGDYVYSVKSLKK